MNKLIQIAFLLFSVSIYSFAEVTPPPPPGIWICDYGEDEYFQKGKKAANASIKNGKLALLLSGIFEDDDWIEKIHDSGITTRLSDYNDEKDQRFTSGFNSRMMEQIKSMEIYHLIEEAVRDDDSVCQQYEDPS